MMNENMILVLPLVMRESQGLYRSKIPLGCTRICSCPSNHINCLTAKEWIKCQLGVWQFFYEGGDIRDKNVHPATFPIALSKRIIGLFTHEGELVLDPFVGSGTTLVAARDLNRNAIGFDLQEKYIPLCIERLASDPSPFPPSTGEEGGRAGVGVRRGG